MDASPAKQLPILLSPDLLAEADRVLTICNACRYCEGVCAVFPALERRDAFAEPDVLFLGNLCHDCRACYYVCPFTEPHEFNLNVPAVLSEVRAATYAGYAWPAALAATLARGWRGIAILSGILFAVIALAIARFGSTGLVESSTGAGAFYAVVPWLMMFVPAMIMGAYALGVIFLAGYRYWRATDGPLRSLADPRAAFDAARDALGLRYLGGGGPGCYVDPKPSQRRRIAHSLVFYGFASHILRNGRRRLPAGGARLATALPLVERPRPGRDHRWRRRHRRVHGSAADEVPQRRRAGGSDDAEPGLRVPVRPPPAQRGWPVAARPPRDGRDAVAA